jgi:prepilin-type N-terminal cleavage/methylation domain-containing protein
MKTRHGFTLIEAAATLAVIGVMATISVQSFKKVYAQSQLQAASMNLLAELKATRTIAMRYDATVIVRFGTDRCTLWVDTISDGVTDNARELYKVYLFPSNIEIGKALNGPDTAPVKYIAYDQNGIAGKWKTPSMNVTNNALGLVSDTGAIYLKSTKLDVITYCIGNTSAKKVLRLYKWGGSSWIKL